MRLPILHRKLLRELWQLKGQVFSIALVVAVGIMSVITLRGSYDSLVMAQQRYYRDTRFAHVWASVSRAPDFLIEKLAEIPGVSGVETRLSFLATLDLPGLVMPAQARFVSLPVHARPQVNDVRVTLGRYLDSEDQLTVLISEKFAQARKLLPGDSLDALINGRVTRLAIAGIAITPEHAYAVPPGALYPDDERYGIIWMNRQAMGPAFDMKGAFNEAVFRLSRDSNEQQVMADIDRVLDDYGSLGSYSRSEQMSHQILQSELDQNRVLGTVFPVVFLGVAAFLLNLVLGRLIATQRAEIGVLKAFGYRDRETGLHFLMFALIAVLLGVVPGIVLGRWLGQSYVALYGKYFNFPSLDYHLSLPLVLISLGVSAAAAVLGALKAVRRAGRLPPAEAMRAESPTSFRRGWLERYGVGHVLTPGIRMIVRNLQRKPVQSVISSLGVALATAILVMGLAMLDSVRFMMDLQFRQIQREDIMLSFDQALDTVVIDELASLEGVTRVEPYRNVAVRLSHGPFSEQVGLQGLAQDGVMRRLVASNGNMHPLPADGIVLSRILADSLRVKSGDRVHVEFLEGRQNEASVLVSGVVSDYLGKGGSISLSLLHRLAGGPPQISGAYLAVERDYLAALNLYLKKLPAIAGVASPASMLESFDEQMQESLYIVISMLLAFAGVIAVGVIYNGARISLSERGRELASLRVMGFRRQETVFLLLGEQSLITLAAIPTGWLIGYWLAYGVTLSIESDAYRLPFIVSGTSFFWSALVTVLAAVLSGLLIRHRINGMDLIEVLKTRE